MTTMPWLPRFRAWPVKLPIQVAVLYEGTPNTNVMAPVYARVGEAVNFYRELRIVLQPSVRGVALSQSDYQELTETGAFEPMFTHEFRLDGAPMTIIYLSHDANWRENTLGRSYAHHLAVVAGNQPLAAETLIHEIGHLLLNDLPTSDDHQSGDNFMNTVIWEFNTGNVTTQQRTRMYEAAYRLGSL